ncbi:MAG TPA: ABC transporter permease [Vicinamibacterales bacterium]|nr:ABC transporter permease [Vicinamibacterales bacterium]
MICVVSIAFGTGANVAIFSMADTLLLRPLPLPHPSEIVTVGSKVLRGTFYRNVASYCDYRDIRERTTSFQGLAAYSYDIVAIAPRASDFPRVRLVAFVSDNFFRALAVELQLGRGFLPEEDGVAGRGSVVVISDGLWRGSFAANPAILGHKMRVAGRDFTVVGVTAALGTGRRSQRKYRHGAADVTPRAVRSRGGRRNLFVRHSRAGGRHAPGGILTGAARRACQPDGAAPPGITSRPRTGPALRPISS